MLKHYITGQTIELYAWFFLLATLTINHAINLQTPITPVSILKPNNIDFIARSILRSDISVWAKGKAKYLYK